MENRKKKWIALATSVAAAIVTYLLVSNVMDFMRREQKKESQPTPTIEELVGNLQSQLPIVQKFEHSVVTQTGVDVRNDSLILSFRIKAEDAVLDAFRDPERASVLREGGLKGMIDDYKSNRLMQMACDQGLVIAHKYYDEGGKPICSLDYSPDDYRPFLGQ